MSNVLEFPLGGQPRQFRLTTSALERVERELGLGAWTELLEPDRKVSAAMTNTLLWCGLLWQDPTVTKAQVMDWIDAAPSYRDCMMTAVTLLVKASESFAEVPTGDGPLPLGVGANSAAPPSASG